MSIITAVGHKGQLHLGYGDENSASRCLGNSINSYRNCISKFFTKLFEVSIILNVDGKEHYVNKYSFKNHLQSIGFDENNIEEISKIGYNAFIQKNADKIILSNNKLGDNFSNKKRMKLFEKMVEQLEVNNNQAVKRLIRKGAYVDREFFKPADGALNGQSFWNSPSEIESDLHDYYLNTNYFRYTPLALAAEQGNQALTKLFLDVKNNDISSDKKQTIHYTVTNNSLNGTPSRVYWKTEIAKLQRVHINEGIISIADEKVNNVR